MFLAPSLGVPALPATAKDARQDCVDAHLRTQRERRTGQLRAARDDASSCGTAACPPLIAGDCADWKRELDAILPSVVLEARTPDGREAVDVRVTMDGKPLLERLDGAAHDVDPGPHSFRFELGGKATVVQTVVLREGEQRRRIRADFAAAPSPPPRAPEPATRPIPTLTYVLAGAGVAALGGFIGLGLYGNARKSDLETCGPTKSRPSTCSRDDVDATRRVYILADVSLGISVVALGAALAVYLARPAASRQVAFTF